MAGIKEVALLTFELVAVAYFSLIGALAPTAASSRRAWPVSVLAFAAVAIVLTFAHILAPPGRSWVAHAYLAAGYWLPALLVNGPSGWFERWLCRTESVFARARTVRGSPPAAELAYLCCYPLVPAAFAVIYYNGSTADIDRFWTSVLGAGYACYISLPWLVSRPPRRLEGDVPHSIARSVNLHLLDRLSHGWNTFPSGHVAVAVAAALSTRSVSPHASALFLVVAAGVTIGSVMGRYHYTVDAIAGLVVGVIACAIAPAVPASAQLAPHVEIAATLADTNIHPIYYKPIAPLTTEPSTPARVGRMLDVATPGIDLAVYVGSRVQGIARRSSVPERTGDSPQLPPLPLPPPGPGPGWQALIVRSTQRANRTIVGAAIDMFADRRVRVAGGGGLQVDRVTRTQSEWMIAFRTGTRPAVRDFGFEPVTLKAPVVFGRIKIYPWKHLLTFADVSVRLKSATGEHALYQAARVTPGFGLGVSF